MDWCWKIGKEPKPNFVANNYLEVLIDDETIKLEQLNHLCGTKHNIFSSAKIPKKRMSIEMQALEVERVTHSQAP